MIINEDYIRSFTEKNLWQLGKIDLQNLATAMNIEFTKAETKDSLLNKIKNNDKYDLLSIYNKYKNLYFGVYPTEAQELLGIDNKTLKKLAKKDIIKIAYTRDKRLYGKYVNIPYYLLESFLISKENLNDAIEKYCKKATEKQLAAISKAQEVSIKNRTCIKCNCLVGKKEYLHHGKCSYCLREEKAEINRLSIKAECINFIKNSDKYLILDTETTGLGYYDEIIEIAIIDMTGKVLLNTRIFTTVPISPEASSVNGIVSKDIEGMPKLTDLNDEINEIFKDRTILIYNENFDRRMLYQSGFEGEFKSECLMNLYMNYIDSDRWVSLQNALFSENVNTVQDHSALGDCLCCLELIKPIANRN